LPFFGFIASNTATVKRVAPMSKNSLTTWTIRRKRTNGLILLESREREREREKVKLPVEL
jgi:hypothetical protein